MAEPLALTWTPARGSVLGRYGHGVQSGATWWRHEAGALREYTLDGEETSTFATGLVDGDLVLAGSAMLLNTAAGARVYRTTDEGPTLQRVWVGAVADVVEGDDVLLTLGTTTALVSIGDDGAPTERACFDRTLGTGFSTWSSGRGGNVWMGAGVEVVGGAIDPGGTPRVVFVALDPARFGSVIAEFEVEAEAPAVFVGDGLIEVHERDRVRWFVPGATTVGEVDVPAVRQDLGAAVAVEPHFVVGADGRGVDVGNLAQPRAVQLTPAPDGDQLPCRIDVRDAGGNPDGYLHPAHFPGVVFEADALERVICDPVVPSFEASVGGARGDRVVLQTGEGPLLAEPGQGGTPLPDDMTPEWVWTDTHLVSVQRGGADFGLPVVDRLVFLELATLEIRVLEVAGRVRIARSDDANLWFVADGRGYRVGDPVPAQSEWKVRRVRATDPALEVFELGLPRGFEPVDAVPDQLGGAWVFDSRQSVLHYDREGDLISQSDIPPGTDATTMTKAANADGLVVADGRDAWWYDPTGIRRPIPNTAVYDVVGAAGDSYCLLLAAVEDLPEGAAGPYQIARVVIERVGDVLSVVPVARPAAADGVRAAGCGDAMAWAGTSVVWTEADSL